MATVNGSYLIARTLKEEGVDTLFYLMGGPDFDIVMSCQDLGIKTIDFRHEQAAAFAFLASDDAVNITGQSLNVNGGIRMD